MCNSFYIEPQDFQMHSLSELASLLGESVTENAVTQEMRLAAVRWALRSQSAHAAYTMTVYGTWGNESCEYDLPCCGANVIGVQYRGEDCSDCYTDMDFRIDHGKLRVDAPCNTSYRLTMAVRNQVTNDQRTIRTAKLSDDGCEYEIYLDGAASIPSHGIVRICGEAWVYRCKSHITWEEDGVLEEEYTWGIDSEVGMLSTDVAPVPVMADHGDARPSGKHTVLYAQRLVNCGSIQLSDLLTELPGVLVEFPVIVADGTQVNGLIAAAAMQLYRLLINGCSTDRDLNRYTAMQKHWSEETIRLQQQRTRSVRARVVTKNEFKSKLPPSNRRSATGPWPFRRVNCCW